MNAKTCKRLRAIARIGGGALSRDGRLYNTDYVDRAGRRHPSRGAWRKTTRLLHDTFRYRYKGLKRAERLSGLPA